MTDFIEYIRENYVHPDAERLPAWQPSPFSEVLARPLVQGWPVFLIFTTFFFFCQFTSKFLMNRLSNTFRTKLSEVEKDKWCVCFVAVVSSIISWRTAYLHVKYAWSLPSDTDLYATIPGYLLQQQIMASFFFYDIIICIYYAWGPIYVFHGIASFSAAFFSCWPFLDRYSGFYSGLFEMTPALIHSAELLKLLHVAPILAEILRGLFAVSFLIIRPIGGTVVGVKLTQAVYQMYKEDWRKTHNVFVAIHVVVVVWSLMILQYVWTVEVVKGIMTAMGIIEDEEAKKKRIAARMARMANMSNSHTTRTSAGGGVGTAPPVLPPRKKVD